MKLTQESNSSDRNVSQYTFGDNIVAANRLKIVNELFNNSSKQFLKEFVDFKPKIALDLGCGPGNTTEMINNIVKPDRLIGIDSSESFLNHARSNHKFEFIQHDVTRTPFPFEPANLIYSRFLLAHIKEPIETVSKWANELAKDGLLLCEEDDFVETNNQVLQKYNNLKMDLVSHNGGDLYIGKQLANLSEGINWSLVSNDTIKIKPPISLSIYNFYLNLQAWRDNPYIKNKYSEAYLDDLSNELLQLKDTPGNTVYEWTRRQIVIKGGK